MSDLADHGVTGKVIRIANHDVKPGVEVDMGDGVALPEIRGTILGCDILVLSTPIWLGPPPASHSVSWNAATPSSARATT
ncbi:hypothetical protein ABZO31_00695 [Streptomyces sp. HUAS MG47]|uniref:hypothetical protein n=1 Tax=Streptomyces solicamelliae TaxID=3231716 RepID=UPI003877A509